MRKSFDTLAGVVRERLGAEPMQRDTFVFRNQHRTRLKILVYNESDAWVMSKRLECSTFRPIMFEPRANSFISRAELAMLLEGTDVKNGKLRKRFADVLRTSSREDARVVDHQPRS